MSGEKTEDPTEQRKKQARREGQIARTPDLATWGSLFVASMILPTVVGNLLERVRNRLLATTAMINDPTPEKALAALRAGAVDVAMIAAPLCLGLFVFTIAANAAQGGLRPATKLFKPNFTRLNPLQGFKRAFGGHALWEAVKAVVKTGVIGLVLYVSVRGLVPTLLTSGSIPLFTLLTTIANTVGDTIRIAAGAGLAMAAADYAMARRRINKQIRMSKQEVKEEHRRSDGDPKLKAAIRAKQMAMSRQRMMAELPKADVILVNPTHVAVALRYDPERGAPRVIAKGAGAIAAKIREKANELRIPMVHDKTLARALYRDCELGAEIPAHFYQAVAKVLAFVMVLKSKGSAAGVHHNVHTGGD